MKKPLPADVFSVLPGSLDAPSEPSGDWWVDLQEVDLNPPTDCTEDDDLLRQHLMGELQFMAFNDRLFYRRYMGLGALARPFLGLRLWFVRAGFNRRLRGLGYRLIPRSFLPHEANERF